MQNHFLRGYKMQSKSVRIGITIIYWFVNGVLLTGGYAFEYDYTNGEYMRDHDPDSWKGVLQRQCVPIPTSLALCRNVGYVKMSLPNLLGHDTVEEVKRQSAPWVLLHNVGCHPNTDLFLCSLYAPVCLESLERPIFPCRSLCEAVKDNCEGYMRKYGFEWPEILRCNKFPAGDSLCIKQLNFSNSTEANVCHPCKQPLTFESLLDSYCWSNYVIKVKIRKVAIEKNGDKRLILKGKMKFYKPKPKTLSKEEIKNMQLVITDGSRCECDAVEKTNKRSLVMASKQGDRYVVTYINDWVKDKEFKRAVRAIRKGHDCKAQIDEIAGISDAINGGLGITPASPTDNKTNGDKNKNKKRKKDKNRKKNKGDKKKDTDPMANIAGIGCIPCKQPLEFDNLITKYCDSDFVIKTKVRKIKMDDNGDKRLIGKRLKSKDFYKQQNLTKRDVRKLQPVISGGSGCDCEKAKKGNKLYIMGKKQGTRYVVNFLSEEVNDSQFKNFLRAIRKGYDCSSVSNN